MVEVSNVTSIERVHVVFQVAKVQNVLKLFSSLYVFSSRLVCLLLSIESRVRLVHKSDVESFLMIRQHRKRLSVTVSSNHPLANCWFVISNLFIISESLYHLRPKGPNDDLNLSIDSGRDRRFLSDATLH